MKRLLFFLFSILVGPEAFSDEVTINGSVRLPGGKPVSNATVLVESARIQIKTDEQGMFHLTLPSGTHTLLVEAEGYEIYGETVTLTNQKSAQLEIVLQQRNLQFEEIVVGAGETDPLVSVSSPTSTVDPAGRAKTSSMLAAVMDLPGVAPMGQGGLFQAPSIRGAARERTILLLESVRVTSERRTGASFSFVDPLLLDRIHVTRGPAPVLYGSNGETGLIQGTVLEPDSRELTAAFRAGYLGNSNENWQAFTLKDGTSRFQYALGAVRREGSDFESGDHQVYPSGYTRMNLFGKARWLTDAGTLTLLAMPTWTNDIEKASSDALTRPTLYPEERHQVYLMDWQNPVSEHSTSYQLQGWLHPNSLITRDERVTDGVITSRNLVYNDTDDYGIRFRVGRVLLKGWRFWSGLDVFGRTNINARQDSFTPSAPGTGFDLTNAFYSIRDGSYLDTGLFLTANGSIGPILANAGIRLQRVRTENNATTVVSDSEFSWSGNMGVSYPFTSNWDGILNLGRGIRPATISEKFFTGETGRGSITGNPDLVTESNLEFDGGIRYRRGNGFAGFYFFRNEIDEFIARVSVEGDRFTYLNLPGATISGIEGEGYYGWNQFRFYGNFHVIQGHDKANGHVNDIPPSRVIFGIEYETGSRWNVSSEFVRQFRKSDPGPDELLRTAAFVVNARGDVSLTHNLKLRVEALNLNNETYFDSADNRAPKAIGRSVGLEVLAAF